MPNPKLDELVKSLILFAPQAILAFTIRLAKKTAGPPVKYNLKKYCRKAKKILWERAETKREDGREMIDTVLQELILLAGRMGAGGAAAISTRHISVEDPLADMCREPRCENYGLSANCPPYVAGPNGFRELLKDYEQALIFKIEVPSEILLSNERRDIFGLLHEIGAAIEQAAVDKGHCRSKAFVGGSCKRIFCQDHPDCRVLTKGDACRNPGRARPSMSGFGINVSKLMQAAGWTMHRAARPNDPGSTALATVSGLVLIG